MKELRLECAGEDEPWSLAYDGAWDAMEFDDFVEEYLCDGDGCVQVTQWEEVGIHGEVVNHGQYYGLVAHVRKTLHEVHGEVGPH
jgi:hypothetical protein